MTKKGQKKRQNFKKLRALDYFGEVHRRLVEGHTPRSVAEFIQTKGGFSDIKFMSLERMLRRYKDQIPPSEIVEANNPRELARALKKLEKDICVHDEMVKIFEDQLERIGVLRKREEEMNFVLPLTGTEIKLAKELLMDIHSIRERLGLESKEPEKIDLRIDDETRDREEEMKRRALVELADKMERIAMKAVKAKDKKRD
jgi:hypothetical protein